MLGEKGSVLALFKTVPMIAKIAIVTIIAVLIVPGAMAVFPIAKYVIMALLIFFIYELVLRALGKGILTFVVTGMLAYFIVYKYLYLSASLMMFYIFLGFGLVSVFFWGTSTLSRKK